VREKDMDHPSSVIVIFPNDKEARNAIIDGIVVNGQRLEFFFFINDFL